MAEWTNWSGKLSAEPRRVVQVGTVDAIEANYWQHETEGGAYGPPELRILIIPCCRLTE